MKRIKTRAVLVAFAIIAGAAEARAYLHPRLGRFLQRDPGPGRGARPVPASRFVPRDPTGSEQYADGPNLYQNVRSNPITHVDPTGLWDADIHRDDTAELAKRAGIACWRLIGDHANAPDEDKARRAGFEGVLDATVRGGGRAKWRRMVEWHFPLDPDGVVRPDSDAAKAKWKAGMKNCNLKAFAEGLHVYQDSWAHQGKPYAWGLDTIGG